MKRKSVFSLQLLLSSILIVSLSVIGCKNNDTTDSSAATDTTATTATMETAPPAATSPDTTMMNNPEPAMKGTAKPNAAKKGMKGKVTIAPAMAPAANAKMEADNSGVYANTEVMPSFPGGNKGLQKFFDDNLEYPAEASNDGVEGTVNVTFVVDENGKLTSPKVEGENLGYGLESEALRVVNKMPTWNPGKLKGKNVKTKFVLPVKFVLY